MLIFVLLKRAQISVFIEIIIVSEFNVCGLKFNRQQMSEAYFRSLMGPETTAEAVDAAWQPVAGARPEMYVYSAFIDRRWAPVLRVVATTKTGGGDKVFCRLWLPDQRSFILLAKIQIVKETHFKQFSGAFVLCVMSSGFKPEEAEGAEVAVVAWSKSFELATNLLKLHIGAKPKVGGETTLHVCVRPLFANYNDIKWTIEWLELNRLLGVSHFYMYNISVGPDVGQLLQHYIRRQIVTLLPWHLPLQTWANGQLAAMQDCLYRSMSKTDWLLNLDLDELVFPHSDGLKIWINRGNENWNKRPLPLIFDKLGFDNNMSDAFIIRNAFFYQDWPADPQSQTPLLTSRLTRRTEDLGPYGIRSKYVVRPYNIVEASIHFVAEFLVPWLTNNYNVDPNTTLLHHYRSKCVEIGCLSSPSTVDRTAHIWTKLLWQRVQKKVKPNIFKPGL